jgi:hypothetical protein
MPLPSDEKVIQLANSLVVQSGTKFGLHPGFPEPPRVFWWRADSVLRGGCNADASATIARESTQIATRSNDTSSLTRFRVWTESSLQRTRCLNCGPPLSTEWEAASPSSGGAYGLARSQFSKGTSTTPRAWPTRVPPGSRREAEVGERLRLLRLVQFRVGGEGHL